MAKLTILVAKLVGGPNAAVTVFSVNRVDKTEALRFFGKFSGVVRVAEQSWRHARPECEDDEGQEVAHGHRPPPLLVDVGSEDRRHGPPVAAQGLAALFILELVSGAGGRHVVEDDQIENGARNVDERVGLVGPSQKLGALEEPALEGWLNEDAQTLLQVDNLEGVLPRGIDCGFLEGDCRESASQLIDLLRK